MDRAELAHFLFEVASDERLRILDSLAQRPRKHAEVARALSMTGSETTRHLSRLTAVGLVSKTANGEYTTTELAVTFGGGLAFLEFLVAHRGYLLDHRTTVLEPEFVERLGELRQGQFVEGTFRVVGAQDAALRAVKRRTWVVTEQRSEQALPVLQQKALLGADVRVIRSRPHLERENQEGREVRRGFPVRTLPIVDVFLAVLDDQAGLCLPTREGKVDLSSMLLLTDPLGYRWSEDLFLRLWDRAGAPASSRG